MRRMLHAAKLQRPEICCVSCAAQDHAWYSAGNSSGARLKYHEIALKPISTKHLPGKLKNKKRKELKCLNSPPLYVPHLPHSWQNL